MKATSLRLPPSSKILAIVGPTASGKTDLGLRLARERGAEIISVDSRQVYRDLPIGTAQPSQTEVPYHLIGFLDPAESFSAAEFVRVAEEKIRDISSRGKVPLLVGGTGLYFKALTEGLAPLPPANPAVRARLKDEAATQGRQALHRRLANLDPAAAQQIPANNIQRLVRALEVYETSGKPITYWHQQHKKSGRALEFIGIEVDSETLHRRIETRCRAMLEQGMVEETEALLRRGYAENCPGLTGLGYPRIIAMLKGTLSKEEALALVIQDTRQYAKRQRTWFRHQLPVTWKK